MSAKDNQKLSKLLSKGFERSVYYNEYKTKSENKNTTTKFRYFFNQILLESIDCILVYSNHGNNAERFNAQKYYLPKGILKNYVIINRKNFYHQAIDSDIKRYDQIRKLTTGQGEDYILDVY